MVVPIFRDSWRAIIPWCTNLDLILLFLTGDSDMQHLLKNTPDLMGKGHYFPLLQQFKGLTNLDVRDDHSFQPQSLTYLPTRLVNLKLQVSPGVLPRGIFPTTLTSLTIRGTDPEGYIKAEFILTTLPPSLTYLSLHNLYYKVPDAGSSEVSTPYYPEVTTIRISTITSNNEQISWLFQNSPALTDLYVNYVDYYSGQVVVPDFPFPERITKIKLKGLPLHKSAIDYLSLFAHSEVSAHFHNSFNVNRTDGAAITDQLLDVLSLNTTGLTINLFDGMLSSLNKFTKLRSLCIFSYQGGTIFNLILPHLEKLSIWLRYPLVFTIPSTVRSFKLLSCHFNSSPSTFTVTPQWRPRVLSMSYIDLLLNVTPQYGEQLEKLELTRHDTIHNAWNDGGDIITDTCKMIRAFTFLTDLSLFIPDSISVDHLNNNIREITQTLQHLNQLSKLELKNHLNTHHDGVLDDLTFPDHIQHLKISISILRGVITGKINFPRSLVTLELAGISISLDNVLSLRSSPCLSVLMITNTSEFSISDLQQMLLRLPIYLCQLVISRKQGDGHTPLPVPIPVGNIPPPSTSIMLPDELLLLIRRRKRFLYSMSWDQKILVEHD